MSQNKKTVELKSYLNEYTTINKMEIVVNSVKLYKTRELIALITIYAADKKEIYDKFRNGTINIFDDILKNMKEYINTIFLNFCEFYLSGKKYDKNKLIEEVNKLNETHNLNIKNYLFDLYEKGKNNSHIIRDMFMNDDIHKFSFGENVTETYVTNFCDKLIDDLSPVKIKQDLSLHRDANVCGFILTELVSSHGEKQIWKAMRGNYINILKFSPNDCTEKKVDKYIDFYKSNDEEYKNWEIIKLFAPNDVVKFFNFQYYAPLDMKVKILSYHGEPITKSKISNCKDLSYKLIRIISKINSEGYCICNIKPEHILKNDDVYTLIDYKYLRKNLSPSTGIKHDLFSSLSLLSNRTFVTFYDDIESFMFIIDYLVGSKHTDNNDKTDLSSYLPYISNFIKNLRITCLSDPYGNGTSVPSNMKEYIKEKYEILTTHINSVIESILVVNDVNLSLSPADEACFKNIKTQLMSDLRYNSIDESHLNEFALQIMNYMKTSCQYNSEIQSRIDIFLS